MYSDSIRERQQELLNVLFKKASGRSEVAFVKRSAGNFTPDHLAAVLRAASSSGRDAEVMQPMREAAQKIKAGEDLELDQEYQNLVNDYKSKNPNKPLTQVTIANLMHNAKLNLRDKKRKETNALMEQTIKSQGMPAFSTAPARPTTLPVAPSVPTPDHTPLPAEGAVSQPVSGVGTPSPVDVGEVEFEDFGYDNTDSPFSGTPDGILSQGQASAPTPAPAPSPAPSPAPAPTPAPTPTPAPAPGGEGAAAPETPATPEGGGSTPSAPKPVAVREAEQAAGQGQKPATPGEGGGATDWNKVVNGLLERVKRHKLMGLGGLGGAGLGALFGGGSFTDRLLWALLGGGAGTGLGYLAEKYLK